MEKTKKITAAIYEVVEIIAVSIIVVVLLFTYVARLSTVDGKSMWDTLSHGDRVIVWGLGYTPQNGDIVVLQEADGYFKTPLVKRVIAKSGDKLYIDFNSWTVFVNDMMLNEPYVTKESGPMDAENYYSYYADMFDQTGCLTIPEGYVFVMGDNRNHSSDSRFAGVGLVRYEDIMGKVVLRVAPLSKFGTLE